MATSSNWRTSLLLGGMLASCLWVWSCGLLLEGWRFPGRSWACVPWACAVVCLVAVFANRLRDPLFALVIASSVLLAIGMSVREVYAIVAFVTGGGSVPGEDHAIWTVVQGSESGCVWRTECFQGSYDGRRVWHMRVGGLPTLGLVWVMILDGGSVAEMSDMPTVDVSGVLLQNGELLTWDMQWIGCGSALAYAVFGGGLLGSWLLRTSARTVFSPNI